jgi:hypothetical protein
MKFDANLGATIVNALLVTTAGVLCWRLKRLAPALILLFMVSSHTHSTGSDRKTTDLEGEVEG